MKTIRHGYECIFASIQIIEPLLGRNLILQCRVNTFITLTDSGSGLGLCAWSPLPPRITYYRLKSMKDAVGSGMESWGKIAASIGQRCEKADKKSKHCYWVLRANQKLTYLLWDYGSMSYDSSTLEEIRRRNLVGVHNNALGNIIPSLWQTC